MKKIIILNGSPQRKRSDSTSFILGKYIIRKFKKNEIDAGMVNVDECLSSVESVKKLIDSVLLADCLIFIAPVYLDTLPFGITKIMEELHRTLGKEKLANKSLLSIIHCGYMEVKHTSIATSVCRFFAKKTNMKWLGGFTLSGGPTLIVDIGVSRTGSKVSNEIDYVSAGMKTHEPRELGIFFKLLTRNIWAGLDAIVNSIIEGRTISKKYFGLMNKSIFPKRFMSMVDRWWLNVNACNNHAEKILYAMPLER